MLDGVQGKPHLETTATSKSSEQLSADAPCNIGVLPAGFRPASAQISYEKEAEFWKVKYMLHA